MKKTLSIILAVLMIVTAIPLGSITSFAEASTVGFSFSYNDMKTEATVVNYSGSNTSVEIPAEVNGVPVVAIANSAFANRSNIENVKIPDSVRSIGARAFEGTAMYENHKNTYPGDPFYIDGHLIVYRGPYSVTEYIIPGGTKSIAGEAFMGNTVLESVVIPKNLVSIGTHAFKNCTILKNISVIEDTIQYIGTDAFYNTAYYNNEANWTDGVLYVANHAVNSNFIEGDITLKAGTRSIADSTFSYKNVANIDLGDSLVRIGEDVFMGCAKLKSLEFGASVKEIEANAFAACSNLETFKFNGTYLDWFNVAFGDANSNPMAFAAQELFNGEPIGKLEIAAEDGITVISKYRFLGCDTLTELVLPEGVISVEESAFANCSALNNVVIPSTLTSFKSDAFLECNALESVDYKGTAEAWVAVSFANQNANPLGYAKNLKFNGVLAENVVINDTVTTINSYVFQNCESIKTLDLKLPLKSVLHDAFNGCVNLTDVYYDGTAEEWAKVSIGDRNEPLVNAVKHCYVPPVEPPVVEPTVEFEYENGNTGIIITKYTGTATDVTIPDTINGIAVTEIGEGAFKANETITNVVIPDSVTHIYPTAFSNCKLLETVKLSANLTAIGYEAFYRCLNLTEITIPETCLQIGSSAFAKCEALTSVVIPEGCIALYDEVFAYCTALSEITLPDTLMQIGYDAFYDTAYFNDEANWDNNVLYIGKYIVNADYALTGSYTVKDGTRLIADSSFSSCNKLTEIIFPESLLYINGYAFFSCSGLENVVFNDGLLTIGDRAFISCSALDNVIIPSSVTTLMEYAFESCSSLKNLTFAEGFSAKIGAGAFQLCEALETLVIPEGVKVIEMNAFARCRGLTSITLPTTLTTINKDAFYDCQAIENIYYNGNADQWVGIKFTADHYYNSSPLQYAENLYFDGELVTDVVLSDAVTVINSRAFDTYSKLKTIYIPKSVKTIQYGAFEGCGLTDVYYDGTATEWETAGFGGRFASHVTIHFLGGDDRPVVVDGATLKVGSVQANAGDTITVPVTLEKVSLATLSYTLAYDSSKLKFVSIDDIAFDMYEINTATNGKIVVFATNNADAVTDVVANVTFEVIATEDCTTNIGVTIKEAYNSDDKAVEMNTASGSVEVITYTLGDLNDDGNVTAIDARWVLQIAAGNKTATEKEMKAADVNGDGKVTAIDARWILQIAAGTRVL